MCCWRHKISLRLLCEHGKLVSLDCRENVLVHISTKTGMLVFTDDPILQGVDGALYKKRCDMKRLAGGYHCRIRAQPA
jgi:hypothetical protein